MWSVLSSLKKYQQGCNNYCAASLCSQIIRATLTTDNPGRGFICLLQIFTAVFNNSFEKSTFLIVQNVLKFAICFTLTIYRVWLTSGAHHFWHWLIHSLMLLTLLFLNLASLYTGLKQNLHTSSHLLLTFWASLMTRMCFWSVKLEY